MPTFSETFKYIFWFCLDQPRIGDKFKHNDDSPFNPLIGTIVNIKDGWAQIEYNSELTTSKLEIKLQHLLAFLYKGGLNEDF